MSQEERVSPLQMIATLGILAVAIVAGGIYPVSYTHLTLPTKA